MQVIKKDKKYDKTTEKMFSIMIAAMELTSLLRSKICLHLKNSKPL